MVEDVRGACKGTKIRALWVFLQNSKITKHIDKGFLQNPEYRSTQKTTNLHRSDLRITFLTCAREAHPNGVGSNHTNTSSRSRPVSSAKTRRTSLRVLWGASSCNRESVSVNSDGITGRSEERCCPALMYTPAWVLHRYNSLAAALLRQKKFSTNLRRNLGTSASNPKDQEKCCHVLM